MVLSSSRLLRPVSVAAHGSAYLLTQRSWTSRIGTGFRKCSFSRPRLRVTTSPAPSSTLRCFITPKRVIGNRCSSALRVCPSSAKSSSSRLRRVGSERALNTSSTPETICDLLVTCQEGGHRMTDRLKLAGDSYRAYESGDRSVLEALLDDD